MKMSSVHAGFHSWLLSGAVALIAAVCVALLAPAAPRAATPARATIARTCSLAGKWMSLGPTYVESLSVSGTSCRTGTAVVKSYNRCRLRSGGRAGHCRSEVLGFRCHERRTSSRLQFVAKVSCTKPRQAVSFTYSENT